MNYTKSVIAAAAIVVAGVSASVGAYAAPVLVNGSLTGPLANANVPTGWSVVSPSPDTNDVNSAAGISGNAYGIAASNSSDGGTWVGIARTGDGFIERFEQTVAGFSVGTQYDVSWELAHFGYQSGYNDDNAVELLIDGLAVGMGDVLSRGAVWFNQSLSFTATAASHTIGFRLASNVGSSYMQIDGIAVSASGTSVPAPAALGFLGLGLAGLGIARRRRST